jgi:hypothetical protein
VIEARRIVIAAQRMSLSRFRKKHRIQLRTVRLTETSSMPSKCAATSTLVDAATALTSAMRSRCSSRIR